MENADKSFLYFFGLCKVIAVPFIVYFDNMFCKYNSLKTSLRNDIHLLCVLFMFVTNENVTGLQYCNLSYMWDHVLEKKWQSM